MQGESFKDLFNSQNNYEARNAVYYHYYEYPLWHKVQPHYGIRTNRYKLMHFYYSMDEWELYDRLKDPNEMNNVYNDPNYKEVVIKLKEDLKDMRIKYKDSEELDKSFIYKK